MRIRLTFSKLAAMQYVGHLDLHRSWERTFRRSGLPLAYSQGFHPQPRLNLACALPLGFTSQCEVLDAWLEADLPLEHVQKSLSASVPPGILISSIEIIDQKLPALQTQVISSVYQVTFLDVIRDLEQRLNRVLSAEQLPRLRRGKTYDLRPLIKDISLLPVAETGCQKISFTLSAQEAATGRPEELLDELGIRFEDTQVHREKLIFCP